MRLGAVFVRGLAVATGSAVGRVLQLLSLLLVARSLGAEGYGVLAMCLLTMGTVTQLVAGGYGGLVTVLLSEAEGVNRARIEANVGTLSGLAATIAVAVASVFAWPVSALVLDHRVSCVVLLLVSPMAGLAVAEGALQGILVSQERQRVVALAPIAVGLVSLATLPWLAGAVGVSGAILGCLLVAGTGPVLLGIAAWRSGGLRWTFRPDWTYLRPVVIRRLVPLSLSSSFQAPMRWIAQTIVALQPGGLEAVAVFNAAHQFHGALNYLPQAIRLSARRIFALPEGARSGGDLRRLTLFTCGIILVPITVAVFVADPIMSLYGPGFVGHGTTLSIVCLASLPFVVYQFAGDHALATKDMKGHVLASLACGAVWVVASVVVHGPMSLAVGLLAGYALGSMVLILRGHR